MCGFSQVHKQSAHCRCYQDRPARPALASFGNERPSKDSEASCTRWLEAGTYSSLASELALAILVGTCWSELALAILVGTCWSRIPSEHSTLKDEDDAICD
jgi:hypothetical protein